MKIDRYFLRGIVLVILALAGCIYEIFTDREIFVFSVYGILLCIGVFLILKVRDI